MLFFNTFSCLIGFHLLDVYLRCKTEILLLLPRLAGLAGGETDQTAGESLRGL